MHVYNPVGLSLVPYCCGQHWLSGLRLHVHESTPQPHPTPRCAAFIQLLPHRFRRIAQLYGQSFKPLAKNSLEASNWNWLYNATDKLTKGWLTHGAKLLQQVTASAKSGAENGDMLQRNASGSSTSSWQSACGEAFGHTMMDQQLSKLMQKTSGGPSKSFTGMVWPACITPVKTSPCFMLFLDVPSLAKSWSPSEACTLLLLQCLLSHACVTLMIPLIADCLGHCLVSSMFASCLELTCCCHQWGPMSLTTVAVVPLLGR